MAMRGQHKRGSRRHVRERIGRVAEHDRIGAFRRAIERSYVEAIRNARSRVDLAVPYFYPGRAFRRALRQAARVKPVVVLRAGSEPLAPEREAVAAEARRVVPGAQIFEQAERRGTAHAVLMARAALEKGADDVLVIFGDTPLLRAETVTKAKPAPGTWSPDR